MRECPGCGAEIESNLLACKPCWFRLPQGHRRAVSSAWKRRLAHPRDEGARRSHEAAKAAAERWYQDHGPAVVEHPAGTP